MPRTLLAAIAIAAAIPVHAGDGGGALERPEPLPAIRAQIAAGHYDEAEKALRPVMKEMEALHGPESVEVAMTLDLLVDCLWRSGHGEDEEALALARRAVTIKEARLGVSHPEVAESVRNLGRVLELSGKSDEAVAAYERSIGILKSAAGASPTQLARSQLFLANHYLASSSYEKALASFDEALATSRAAQGEGPRLDGLILNNIGIANFELGHYVRSRAAFEEALALKAPGSLDEAWTLNGLAVLLEETGNLPEARALYERVLRVREKELGPTHINTIGARNNLANLLREAGELTEAKEMHSLNRTSIESSLGHDSSQMAETLNGLAMIQEEIGDAEAALALLEEALAIRRKRGQQVQAATLLQRLGSIELENGRIEPATSRFEQAKAIYTERLGPAHPDVAYCLRGLADARHASGDRDGALALHTKALEILKQSFGDLHYQVATSLDELGRLALERGDAVRARALFEEALAGREATLGKSHPLVGEVLVDLGQALEAGGASAPALESALRAERIGRDHLREAVAALPERQALLYARVRASGLDLAARLAEKRPEPASVRGVWDAVIRSRALILDEMAARRRAASGADDPNAQRLVDQLGAARARLSMLVQRGPGEHLPGQYAGTIEAAAAEKERLEEELARVSLRHREALDARTLGLARVEQELPADSALVAFLLVDASPPAGAAGAVGATPSYAAFVLKKEPASVAMVAIGPRTGVDDAVQEWLQEVSGPGGSEERARAAGERLRTLIWDPLSSRIAGAKILFLVPEGAINLVNLYALPVEQSRYLIETAPVIQVLSAEREIVRSEPPETRANLLAVGNPSYDDASSFAALAGVAAAAKTSRPNPGPVPVSGCPAFRDLTFAALPETAAETREIVALWRGSKGAMGGEAMELSGSAATEAAFKRGVAGAGAVHLATHGFFLDGHCGSTAARMRGIGGVTASQDPAALEENAMLLSGLVLAGANHRLSATEGEEDGILSAEEISGLDLGGVAQVVLSACDTGRGAVLDGEGVFGLRRAFALAGARTLVLSLWSVEDKAGRAWMSDFYSMRLTGGMSAAEAVRGAGLSALKKLKGEGRATHPFWWGAWIAAGGRN